MKALRLVLLVVGLGCFAGWVAAQMPLPPTSDERGLLAYVAEISRNAARKPNAETVTGSWTFTGPLRYGVSPAANTILTGNASGDATWGAVPPAALPSGLVRDSAVVNLTNQAASIGTTTLYTPAVASCWRVSVYQVTTSAGAAGTLTTTIGWTDDDGAQTSTLNLTLAGLGYAQSTLFIRSTATAITYATTLGGVVGSPKYALYVRLEYP